MLSNAYFLAKFRFDTAENEPAKNLQIFEKCIFEKCIFEKCIGRSLGLVRSGWSPSFCGNNLPGDGLRSATGALQKTHHYRGTNSIVRLWKCIFD